MAFKLKKVLRALLYSSSQPLAIKDIQAAFGRYHDADRAADGGGLSTVDSGPKADNGAQMTEAGGQKAEADASAVPSAVGLAKAEAEAEIIAEAPSDPELYADVPSMVTLTQIREVMDEIAEELRVADNGLLLIEGASGYRLATHPRFARWVRILRSEPPPLKLSPSSLETLAVIAYRQPVTRAEIEAVRGVSAEAGLNRLIERELIQITGRADQPGRPLQYGTTDHFLEFVGVKSVDDLPASDVLSNRQIDDWLQKAMNPTTPGDAEMGLPYEQMTLRDQSNGSAETPQTPGNGTAPH